MSIKKILLKWVALIGLAVALGFYLDAFSPYGDDGSLNAPVVLVAFATLATLAFFMLQAFFALFFKHRSASQLAFVGSFALIQVVLINSWSFINLSSMLVILLFNFFICWYALKVL